MFENVQGGKEPREKGKESEVRKKEGKKKRQSRFTKNSVFSLGEEWV